MEFNLTAAINDESGEVKMEVHIPEGTYSFEDIDDLHDHMRTGLEKLSEMLKQRAAKKQQ